MSNQERDFQEHAPMSYQEKNVTASLVVAILILVFYAVRIFQFVQTDRFVSEYVFRLWGTVIGLTIVGTIVATIFAHIFSAIGQAIRTQEEPEIEDVEDERDKVIELKGTRVSYIVSSIGVLGSMLTYVLDQSPLVMFSLLILSCNIGQIFGDASRLYLYRRGINHG